MLASARECDLPERGSIGGYQREAPPDSSSRQVSSVKRIHKSRDSFHFHILREKRYPESVYTSISLRWKPETSSFDALGRSGEFRG
jgi:hypothetical protein